MTVPPDPARPRPAAAPTAVLLRRAPALAAATAVAAVAVLGAASARAATPATAGLALAQQVGQVFMVGAPAVGAGAASTAAIRDRHVGGVILTGRSTRGVAATAAVTAGLQRLATPAATGGVPLLVATDQEGGRVQVLQGPGFSVIPSALVQGRSAPATLRRSAGAWGRQLRAAGVRLDLAPVLDTVPSPAAARTNPPIGRYDREYGYTPATVGTHGTAVAQGLADAGLAGSVKHFPGLGRVTGNTDVTAGVTDRVTTRTDPYLAPFRTAVRAGARVLMVSTAVYARIDPAHPAAFSSTVIQGMVRHDLGFVGVVVSDDLGSARQVAAWSPGRRALQFLAAGGDLVLTVDPGTLPAMYDAVLARARADAAFRGRVQQAALRVLALKRSLALVAPRAAAADLHVVLTQATGSGRTEVHALSAASGFRAFDRHSATALGPVDRATGQFALADFDGDGVPDLWFVKTAGSSGRTELHVLSGATGYRTWLLHAVTLLPRVALTRWTFGAADADGDGRADLWAVDTVDPGSRRTAVFAWDAHALTRRLVARATPLAPVSLRTNAFLFGDRNGDGRADVWDIVTGRTGSGTTEVHVLDGRDPGRWLLHTATALRAPVALSRFAFALADRTGSAGPDLYAVDRDDPATGRTSVHVLSGPSYRTWGLHAATPLAPLDPGRSQVLAG